MFPVRAGDAENRDYHDNLALIRTRILGFTRRKLTPHHADFAQAEDIAQSCVVALWQQYPEKQELSEMLGIAIGIARHKIAQFRRDLGKEPDWSVHTADLYDPKSGDQILESVAAREQLDRVILAMLRLPPRCRELLRLKLIEQKSYAELRLILGITGNIYEMTKRCHTALLRMTGGGA